MSHSVSNLLQASNSEPSFTTHFAGTECAKVPRERPSRKGRSRHSGKGNKSWDDFLTRHALERMASRHVSPQAVQAALDFGLLTKVRGAWIYRIGRREVLKAARQGVSIKAFEGTHVVCGANGNIMTAYKNRTPRRLRQ